MSDSLFKPNTSKAAGEQAALKVGSWRGRILVYLAEKPSTLFEVATHFGVPDHVISGRFSELERDNYIERSGDQRIKPESGCAADVWQLRRADRQVEPDLAELLGYPLTLTIDSELYDRQKLLPSEGYPGVPYARRADNGGLRLTVRVQLVECPICGKALKLAIDDAGRKVYRCGTERCNHTWHGAVVEPPGRSGMLSVVIKTMT